LQLVYGLVKLFTSRSNPKGGADMAYGDPPTYRRIADDLRARILSGALQPGGQLPPQSQVGREYGVSEIVTRQAYRLLVAEGVAEARPGAGTYVRQRPAVTRLFRGPRPQAGRGSPFRAEMADRGIRGDWIHNSETTTATPDIADRLAIAPGDRVMRTRYTYRADGEPVMLATSWEPLAITGGTPIVLPEAGPLAGAGVVDRMTSLGITAAETSEVVSTRPGTADEAQTFAEPPGAPVLVIVRTYWDDAGRPLETADIIVPGSRRELEYRMPINPA